jgi:adenylate kinase family enzyme
VLLGPAGAGKSTLARWIAERTVWPAIILDEIWQKSWSEAAMPAFREQLVALHASKAWVSGGNFAAATFDIRLPRADLIVWVEAPKWRSVWRAVGRTFQPGEAHRLRDIGDVVRFIWVFDRVNRPRLEALKLQIAADIPVHHLSTREEVAEFLESLTNRQ